MQLTTTAVFRDPSAWYHIYARWNSALGTAALYVNGVQQALTTQVMPSGSIDMYLMSATPQYISVFSTYGSYFDGYMAEVYGISGAEPSHLLFGQFDPETGQWVPLQYSGSYGTNGFYLDFRDNTSPNTLCYDRSGNGNHWTPNNISTTAGYTYDSMTDVPTLTSATAANFAVLNPLDASGDTISNANLRLTVLAGDRTTKSSIGVSSGQYYLEVYLVAADAFNGGRRAGIGVCTSQAPTSTWLGNSSYSWSYLTDSGYKCTGSVNQTYGTTSGTGTTIGIALDLTGAQGTITFYRDGVSLGTAFSNLPIGNLYFPAAHVAGNGAQVAFNFGQRPFAYTPPTGFKALNTFNLPEPSIKKPNQYMDATTYTGTGANQVITNAGGFQPDFVWLKGRSLVSNHRLFDSSRGVGAALVSNGTGADYTDTTSMSAFNPNGFSVGVCSGMGTNDINANGSTYVAWQWKKGATPGFDIVTYTGNGTAGYAVNHSLGQVPAMIIIKNRATNGTHWRMYHKSIGQNSTLYLNLTNAAATGFWNNTAPTTTQFTLDTDANVNQSGVAHIAYLFAEIPGFSKFGSYIGNGSADGPNIVCGFRPKYVMYKVTNTTGGWVIHDSSRSPYNATTNDLWAEQAAAENNDANRAIDFTSNGFKIRGTNSSNSECNVAGNTYIYAAFAEAPFKYANAR